MTAHVHLTDRYTRAVEYAASIHAIHVRKGTSISYLSHLLAVSAMVIEAGGDETQSIAGLLHDAAEDAGGEARLADIASRFGDEVAALVRACSDSTDEEWKSRTPWRQRKAEYLAHLATDKDLRAVLVSMADKVHNARAIVTDIRTYGPEVLAKFNAPAAEILWYYVGCLEAGAARGTSLAVLWPLYDAVHEMEQAVASIPGVDTGSERAALEQVRAELATRSAAVRAVTA